MSMVEDDQGRTTESHNLDNTSNTDEQEKLVQNYFVVKCKAGNKSLNRYRRTTDGA